MNAELRNFFVEHFDGARVVRLPTGSHYMEGWLAGDGAQYMVSQNCVTHTVVVTRDQHYVSAGASPEEALKALRYFTEGRAATFRPSDLTRFVAAMAQKPVYNGDK